MAILEMEKIKKIFGSGHTKIEALKEINFKVEKGEFISIVGPSGSGKSTFLTIAGGLQNPTSGQISINGKDLTHLPEKGRSKIRFSEIGFILQSSNLIPFLTVLEQFELVNKVEKKSFNKDKAIKLLNDLGIEALKNKYPRDLSGGERQRAAIARALYHEPSLILADEPTASLDTERALEVTQILVREAHQKAKATVMVTHDLRMTKWSDRIYKMEDGILVQA